jgi:hypothetical protein
MKRYNQGFGKFGPMEQCNDGEWVRYEDVKSIIKKLQEEVRESHESIIDLYSKANFYSRKHRYKKDKELLYLIGGIFLGASAVFIWMML